MSESEFTFESVRQRWEESLRLLETLKKSLKSLGDAAKNQSEISESITDASSQLQNMCEALSASTAELETTMSQLRSIAEASGRFLEGEDLKAARSDMATMRAELAAQLEVNSKILETIQSGISVLGMDIESNFAKVQDRLSALEQQNSTRLTQTETDLSEARQRVKELEAFKSQILSEPKLNKALQKAGVQIHSD